MLTLITSALCRPAVVPTAFFHGTHDNCDNNRFLTEVLSKDLEAPVECIEIGNGIENSINTPVATLAIMACETLMSNPTFQVDEINVIGFSMGGLIARFIAQDCPIRGKVRNMITVGTPNMGITGIPACGSADIYEGNQDFESYMKAIGCRILNFAAK
jgi:triacylglycerol esterase/lipase EstA (alpha/beta hydrolase family)